jgi:hypothetical protein
MQYFYYNMRENNNINNDNGDKTMTDAMDATMVMDAMDNADLATIETAMTTLPITEALTRIGKAGGQFFSVSFERKNDKKKNGVVVELAGTIRKMVCRRGVAKYVEGTGNGNRAGEDTCNNVLTVWDVGVYQAKRKEGMTQECAGKASYRRINLRAVREMSA